MKLRIKGNSIRFRLTKTDLANLANTGKIEEHTKFVQATLTYTLASNNSIQQMTASFSENNVLVEVPERDVKAWPNNDIVGYEAYMPLPDGASLFILIEKDFACLDHTHEDQSDNYENPNKVC